MEITYEEFKSLRELLEDNGYSEDGAYNMLSCYMQQIDWAIERVEYLKHKNNPSN